MRKFNEGTLPIYTYKCNDCTKEVDVIRSMVDSDVPPNGEDSPISDCEHKWKKIIKTAPTVTKGWNWGPGKGNW